MLKIMIVDDMDIVRLELKRLKLWDETSGFVISNEAKNGYEALEELRKNPVDLIITDIRMPKIDGIELLKCVTGEKLCSCVVLMSDHTEFNYARQGLVLGAFDYIVKPIAEDELKKLLERARNFITDKQREQQRIRQLEQSLADKKGVYFPHTELNQLLEMIKIKDARASEYAANIVEIVYSNLNSDIVKTEGTLINILNDIINQMQEEYKWLNKFIYMGKPERFGFYKSSDFDSIKAAFVLEVKDLIDLLRKLKYGSHENEIVDQVCKCVLDNIDENISLKTVSDLIFMNKTYISESFKQKSGISFTEYLTVVKMERAKRLIAEERLKAYETAEFLGFKDIEYFSKLFKKYTGLSPTEYKQKIFKKS